MKSIADLSILIVEDEPLQRAFLMGRLRQLGAGKILEACDGAEAIGMMEVHAVDLIFCDIGMPNMDGPQFIITQLERGGNNSAPRPELPMLVWMSVLDPAILESHSRLARSAGFSMVEALSKPLSAASVSYVIELAMALQQSSHRKGSRAGKQPAVGEDDLLRAICGVEEFEVWYHPMLSLESGLVVGAEAEMRWNHPRFRQLRPERFMEQVERQGLGLVLFYRTVNHVLRQLSKLKDSGDILCMGIKASAQTLQTPEIADYLAERIRQHHLSPDQVSVILADSGATAPDVHLSASLNRLRIKGFRLFLSDFGAGGANMKMLAEMPFNGICIDTGFISQMARHPPSRDMVATILGLGRRLGLPVVAGGVDSEETLALLRGMDCRLVKGSIAPALKAADFLRAVRLEHAAPQEAGGAAA